MKNRPAVVNGRCRLFSPQESDRVHCQSCRTHPKWRAQGGFPEACPHGYTEAILPNVGQPAQRPGTELRNLLKSLGITDTTGCSCNDMAARMDANGVEWCEAHLDEIVYTMTTEATKRNWTRFIPFKEVGAEGIVRLAINRSGKKDYTAYKWTTQPYG